ncbi:MAG: flavoprotein [Pirellulaceae bacterium]
MRGRRIVVGVTGGIAAYKSAVLVSHLVQQGAEVSVVMTESSLQFIGTATFVALTGRPVHVDMFDQGVHRLGPHIELAEWTELLCVAPATANFLAKSATGVADDLLSTLYLAVRRPVVVAPAMNTAMWSHAAVQRNVQQLRTDGVVIVDPDAGWLSCRQQGAGRMAAPEHIADVIDKRLPKG